jgi:hypothetical protein
MQGAKRSKGAGPFGAPAAAARAATAGAVPAATAGAAASIKEAPKEIKMNSETANVERLRQELVGVRQELVDAGFALRRAKDIEKAIRDGRCAAERRFREELQDARAQFSEELRASQEAEQRARDWLRLLGVSGALEGPAGAAAAGPQSPVFSPRSPPLSPDYPELRAREAGLEAGVEAPSLEPDFMLRPARAVGYYNSPPGSPRPPQYSPPGSPPGWLSGRPRQLRLARASTPPDSPRSPPYPVPGSPQYSPPPTPAYSFPRALARGASGALAGAAAGVAAGAAAGGPSGALAAAPASLDALDAEKLEALERDLRAALARVELAQERLKAWEAVGEDVADFRCPITGEIMHEPVMLMDGNSYEKKAIEEWFREQKRKGNPFTSPTTRLEVSTELVVNRNLKNVIAGAVEAKLAELGKRKRED